MRQLNLGCGRDVRRGYINADKIFLPGINAVCDIDKGLPFKSDAFDEVLCKHVLEHVNDFMGAMTEVHRILKKDGIVNIEVPHCSSVNAYSDPTHKSFFTYKTMDFFEETSECNFYTTGKFKILRKRLHFSGDPRLNFLNHIIDPIVNRFPLLYERFFLWILPVNKIFFVMKVIKDEEK